VNPDMKYNKPCSPYNLAQKPLSLVLVLLMIGLLVQIECTFASGNELKEELLVNLSKSKGIVGFILELII
jgi:hypothetical protein